MEYDFNLKPWVKNGSNDFGGEGYIEPKDDKRYNIVWQSRTSTLDNYQIQLSQALISIFRDGAETPAEIAAGLNKSGIRIPGGEEWTKENFKSEMHRLGT